MQYARPPFALARARYQDILRSAMHAAAVAPGGSGRGGGVGGRAIVVFTAAVGTVVVLLLLGAGSWAPGREPRAYTGLEGDAAAATKATTTTTTSSSPTCPPPLAAAPAPPPPPAPDAPFDYCSTKLTAPLYGNDYFSWQKTNAEFGGRITALLFNGYVKSSAAVLDFGCGTGSVLKALIENFPGQFKRRACIELNPLAREHAKEWISDLELYEEPHDIKDGGFDFIFSNHAIEHVPCPLKTLMQLRGLLKVGGTIVIAVPYVTDEAGFSERLGHSNEKDNNHHLFAWTPVLMSNLFQVAKIKVVESTVRKYTRGGNSDAAFAAGGAAAFWPVAERENVHPQTFLVGTREN